MKKTIALTIFLAFSNSSTAEWVHMTNVLGYRNVNAFTISGNNVLAGVENYGIYLTSNNGINWTQTTFNIHSVWALAVNGNNVFAGTYPGGVFLSTDSGTNWSQTSLSSQTIYSLAVSGNYIFAGTWLNGVYITTDNGTIWTQTALNNRVVFSLAVSGNNIFAGTWTNGVYLSTDNGNNWSQTSLNNLSIFSLAANGNTIFAGTDHHGIYFSTNNGTNWTQTPLETELVYSFAVIGNNVFAGANHGGDAGVYVSNDNGANWIERSEGLPVNNTVSCLCIHSNYIFAGSGGSIYRRQLNELIGIEPISGQIPAQYTLYQNYPNPFNPSTNIRFDVPAERNGRDRSLQIIIYDMLGREIVVLVNENLKPGTYEVEWDGGSYPSGIYFYKLTANNFRETKRMVIFK
ncbi:MAG: T9SS type A sorting domain-containing protein [Ignavibacteria bacterium]|nr:T9SS type A sorting domain-containing protein [Ignavibacteria bacterium]